MFLELWKRKQAVIQWQWDLDNYEEEEELRPEFEEKVTTTRINPVTNKPEPYLPIWNQITRLVAANSLVILMVSGCVALVLQQFLHTQYYLIQFLFPVQCIGYNSCIYVMLIVLRSNQSYYVAVKLLLVSHYIKIFRIKFIDVVSKS